MEIRFWIDANVRLASNPGEDEDGFRPQGRPRKTAGGSSKVVLDDIGEYQPSQQFYISNTPGKQGKSHFIEFGGNLVPITKSGDQLSLRFFAFRENRIPFNVKVKELDLQFSNFFKKLE